MPGHREMLDFDEVEQEDRADLWADKVRFVIHLEPLFCCEGSG